jgi:curved DNA-binding protein CbpA
MTEQEILQKAYVTFGLEYGSSFDAIKRRYKRLIMVWHPDRFPNAEGKQDAEDELKRINDAKDKLFAHFEKNHKESGSCSCREQPKTSSGNDSSTNRSSQGGGTGQGPGPGKRRTTQENDREEAEAKKRNEERARRAAAETAEKERQAREAATASTAHTYTFEDALTQQKRLQEERLRWKLAMGLCAAWIGLSIYGSAGAGIKDWWHDVTWKWERDHQPVQPQVNNTAPEKTPYIEPYNKFPGGNQTSWQQQQEADQRRRDEEAERKKKQDIYDTRSALDRYQKTIDHCNAEIAKVDAQLADPSVSDYEKNKSTSYQNAQRGYLAEAQANLAEAQRRFTELTGRPASEANLTEWGPTSSPTITPSGSNSNTPLNSPIFGEPAPPPVTNTNTVQPWRPAYSLENNRNLNPNPANNGLFAKPNYLFKKNQ